MIRSEHIKCCLAALIHFMLFKGLGSFKKIFLNRRKWRRMKGLSIDTTYTPPLFSFYTTFKSCSEHENIIHQIKNNINTKLTQIVPNSKTQKRIY
jgi:hypothetical protein